MLVNSYSQFFNCHSYNLSSMAQNINIHHVVEALNAIHLPGATPQQIHIANSYLTDCETQPQFCNLLLQIYEKSNQVQLQLSSILLYSNVIKRNWTNRGKSTLKSGLNKGQIKKTVMQACLVHNMRHYKQFNALFKTLVRSSYPAQYPEMHEFVLNSLQNMAQMAGQSPQLFLSHPLTVPVLSMIKTIIKQYSIKRIAHSQSDFRDFIAPIVRRGAVLSQLMQNLLKQAFSSGNVEATEAVLQMARKADKIMLYGLSSMPSSYQSETSVNMIIKQSVLKIKEYDNILSLSNVHGRIREEIQKYMIGIFDIITKIQHNFPFIFSTFLQQYLELLITMAVVNIPSRRYSKDKLISAIIIANSKPINTYPYYTDPVDFQASIYCRKSNSGLNNEVQAHCNSIFKSMYRPEVVQKILIGVISEIMTIELVWESDKSQSDDLILEDVEIAIVDQVGEPTAYENCVTLCKLLVKNFKEDGLVVLRKMLDQIGTLKEKGVLGNMIITNLIEIVLYLPHVCDDTNLPLAQVCEILSLLYSANRFKELSKLIRKYHSFLDSKMGRSCFELLVQIVSSPINQVTTPDVIYQSALALKCLLNESYQFDGCYTEAIVPCIANILNIMKMKQFVNNPTLLWPIINLIIKLISTSYRSSNSQLIGIAIVNGLSNLLSLNNNQELIVSGLCELVSCILHMAFSKVKNFFPMEGQNTLPEGEEAISQESAIIYEGTIDLIQKNIENPALQNFDVIYRIWLTLLRHYPTLTQQRLYGINLAHLNAQLNHLFQQKYQQIAGDSTVIFLQILQQMYLLGITPLEQQKLINVIINSLQEQDQEAKRVRTVLATISLYLSYALTKNHVPKLLGVFMQQLMIYKSKISPAINTLRCFMYIAFNLFILTHNALQAYQELTAVSGGSFIEWFQTYVYSMQYVSTKEISKFNAATILKAMSDIGYANFAQMLLTPKEGQYPMDWVLRTIYVKLDAIPEPSIFHEDYLYKNVIPNDYTPEFAVVKLRKLRLFFGNPLVQGIKSQDLREVFKERFSAMFIYLNWGIDDIEQRVGYGAGATLSNLLGWTQGPKAENS